MFFIGILIGGGISFNIYYWYPLLQKQFELPMIAQFGKNNHPLKPEPTITTQSSSKEETTTSTSEEDSSIKYRTNPMEFTKVDAKYQGLQQELEGTISQYGVSGTILAIKDNKVVLHNNYGKALEYSSNSLESTYMIASVQKLITSIMLMNLIEDGKIDLDTKLSTYYPNIPNSENITIDQMLSMTSGLFLSEKLSGTMSKEQSIEYVVNNVTYEPLEKWKYSDVNLLLFGAIIEKLSCVSYEEYFEKKIKTPLELEHTGFYDVYNPPLTMIPSYKMDDYGNVDPTPLFYSESSLINELGTGNMYISTGDLVILLQGLFDEKLVPKDIIKKVFTRNPASVSYTYKAGLYDQDTNYYGHGVFRGNEPTLVVNKDASEGVIFLSDVYTKDKRNVDLTKKLYQQVVNFQSTTN